MPLDPMMAPSDAGYALLREQEGLVLHAYRDVTGTLTIGYGHCGPDVHEGLVWTQDQAEAALEKDAGWAAAAVNRYVNVTISQAQFDALVDFTFNEGTGALFTSTLLKKLNGGDYAGAADEFLRWDKDEQGGKLVDDPVLERRRKAERAMFLSGVVDVA